jgi:RNase P subunit RPR2
MKKKELPPPPKCNHFIWKRVNNGSSIDHKGRVMIVCEKCAALGVIEEGRAKW